MSTQNLSDADLYGLLEINSDANEADIRRAYRKKALKCHPDKNPDNPEASKLFHELSKALKILTDGAARTAYDKLLNAKKAAELRNQLLDSKRKKFKDDLEQREQDFNKKSSGLEKFTDSFEKECIRLRQEASKILEEEQKLLNDKLKQSAKGYNNEEVCDSTQCRLKIKWKSGKKDASNGGYNNDVLTRFLKKYGDIIAIVMSKKNGSAMVEFNTLEAAQMALSYEKGLLENPLKLEWISPPSALKTNSCTESIYDNEDLVLRKLRQAEERKFLIQQMQKEDSTNECASDTPSNDVLLSSTTLTYADIKSKLFAGHYTLQFSKRGTSMVWKMFGTIKDENGAEIPDLVACKICYSVMRNQAKYTSNLTKHKCYRTSKEYLDKAKCDVDYDTKKKASRIVTAWAVHNCRSFKIIEDNGLKKFTKFMISIGARYGDNIDLDKLLPSPVMIFKNINNLYNNCSENIKTELHEINDSGYALTSDICTDNHLKVTYVSITMHYIKESTLFKRFIGLKSTELEHCTNERIREKIQEALMELNCDLNNAISVTNRKSNMMGVFSTYDHISCINHLLHDVIEKSIQEVPELKEMCDKCAEFVKYIKKSGVHSELAISLKRFSPTRWNRVYYLLYSIENNWTEIKNIVLENNLLHEINEITISLITAVLKVLKFFEETSKQLESDINPTLHLVIPHVYRLKRLCVVSNEDCQTIKVWKEHLNLLLETTVVNNITIFHKIALFLYPPTNKLTQFSTEEKNNIKNECKRIMDSFVNNTYTKPSIDLSEQIPNETIDLFSAFIETQEDSNVNGKINSEIYSYENIKGVLPNDFDVLQWWHLNRSQYPLLYKLSCKIFATPATIAASEAALSHARNLITESGCSNFATVNKTLFIHYNMDAIELFNLTNIE
ncbi:uncharacterized protein LOC119673117 [Teleopsis dalmanni]|uniref:uncharacterized protein LOC119673117 n=1 Tax=Teleopsis dalmanni TaxID=139649 RepID=UPI0018CD17AD|nr:uncharacterized protein LOC119673117 [Teleopsis dalmanni]